VVLQFFLDGKLTAIGALNVLPVDTDAVMTSCGAISLCVGSSLKFQRCKQAVSADPSMLSG
jgi:hypothetical protein